MTAQCYYFAGYKLDPIERQLWLNAQPLELNARYLDALVLLVQEAGKLVSKERFFTEVWQGVVVSDEALTQCIRTLRRLLQDNAAAPQFIATVPKHGYRFIAQVHFGSAPRDSDLPTMPIATKRQQQNFWTQVGYGVAGAASAGAVGGLIYGLMASIQLFAIGSQALTLLLVILSMSLLVAVLGGAAVAAGITLANRWYPKRLLPLLLLSSSAGLLVGAFVSRLLQDAFWLFIGRSPTAITGATEGLWLGLAAGCSYWLLTASPKSLTRKITVTTLCYATGPGLLTGLLLSGTGGQLLAGSLAQLIQQFPQTAANSLLNLASFQPTAGMQWWPVLSTMFETSLFTAGLTLGLCRAKRRLELIETPIE